MITCNQSSGKSLTEHLEAVNHVQAVDYIWQLSGKTKARDIDLEMLLAIHCLILDKIDDTNAGRLRRMPIRVLGSSTVFPNYMRVAAIMDELVEYLRTTKAC